MNEPDLEALLIDVAGVDRYLYLRRDSSDTALVGQIFIDDAFDLSRLPRMDELRGWLLACRSLGRRPLIVDAGANIGLSAIAFAIQVADALIVAVEPEPGNVELLVANTEGLPVLPLPVALSGAPGRVAISDHGRGNWGYQTTEPNGSSNAIHVPTVTIDEIFDTFSDVGRPCIVKIDIEGAEAEVFAAECEWINKVPLVIVELHDWMIPRARSSHPVLRRLLQADRDFVIIGENLFCMPNTPLRFADWIV
ncbi:FkbM family methyltransferase [Rhizobium sp. P32RR-XVIII]|uniref:FkbM family methyltransferase n=1 Tax=Rhizobium sp. P32RR-XVIII TaxID=2726738 RepID=UPI00145792C9|nr:FkbM family methyltransferase [Rhizobium sp. P32RR-XVIII]NLS08113.1 FkbM family methyltransferase [Rhizobium sp. P32RR-XVIII]